MADNGAPRLRLRGVSKRFGAVRACANVDFHVRAGEIVALLGENGAGKTTLMNMAFGAYAPDDGEVEVDGQPVRMRNSADALAAGIGMVHQHFRLVPRHTVAENLLAGAPGRGARLDTGEVTKRLAAIADEHGLALPADATVGNLSAGEQQRLEIIKALYRGARVLILDEPTSVLTPQQSEALFASLRALKANGVGIVFISHKLRDVLALCDRLVIMRRGAVVDTRNNDGSLEPGQLAELMCGEVIEAVTRAPGQPGKPLLEVTGASAGHRHRAPGAPPPLEDVSFTLRAGEILGVAGVSGSGQETLAELVVGATPARRGSLSVAGKAVRRASRARLKALGVAYVPEDRMAAGLIGSAPLAESLLLGHHNTAPLARFGWLRAGRSRAFARRLMLEHDIRAPSERVRTSTLSGGNQQKALLARELAFDPQVLVVAQPTQGLDAGAVAFVHRTLLDLRARGRAVLLISEDLDELLALSDRLLVMFDGRVAGEVDATTTTRRDVGLLMTGAGH